MWGPLKLPWTNDKVTHGAPLLTWPTHMLPRVIFHLSSDLGYLYFLSPFCTEMVIVPKLYLEKLVIKSQPLINSFNIFYFLWIYFNSFTCPKILKFSPKIPKFMAITPIIINSIFPLSPCTKNYFINIFFSELILIFNCSSVSLPNIILLQKPSIIKYQLDLYWCLLGFDLINSWLHVNNWYKSWLDKMFATLAPDQSREIKIQFMFTKAKSH
jgi:hypothetical protein